jgi:hypothetical protein
METILEDEGIELLKEQSRYFLRFDAGELAVKMLDLEITEAEANSIVQDANNAYDIIIGYQNKDQC